MISGRLPSCSTLAAALVLTLAAAGCTAATGAATPVEQNEATRLSSSVDPSRRGPFHVGYAELALADPFRVRLLPLSVWYPAEVRDQHTARYDILPVLSVPAIGVAERPPVASGRHPVVLFSHGSGASRLTYWFMTEMLASHGFIVIAPDHVGNTFGDLADVAAFARTASERPKDARFLVDQIVEAETGGANVTGPELRSLLGGHVDIDRIGIAGHSYGGYTALASAGGTQLGDPPDPRIKAVAALEPLSDKLTDENLSRVTVPTLLMGGTLDFTTPIDPMVTRPFAAISTADKLRVDILGASHESFTILCATDHLLADPAVPNEVREVARRHFGGTCGPEVVPASVSHALISRYLVSFFGSKLAHDSRYAPLLSPTDGVSITTPPAPSAP